MALRKDFEFKKIVVKDCYIRIVYFKGDKKTITVTVAKTKDPQAPIILTEDYSLPYSLDAGNPLEQAYAYLKTLPEFADAVDC